jgi:transposase-like protein
VFEGRSLGVIDGVARRATRHRHSAEDKIRIVLEGLRGEVSVAELCRKVHQQNLYCGIEN